MYALKENGIAEGYRQGLLRYAGATAQGLGVFEYGEGGMSCFHSTLHPIGVERIPIADHPEILFVAAKKSTKRIVDAKFTLESLPTPSEEFERSKAPAKENERKAVTCWKCGQEGHTKRSCFSEGDTDEGEYYMEIVRPESRLLPI